MRDFEEASKGKIARKRPVVPAHEGFALHIEAFAAYLEGRRMSPATVKARRVGLGRMGAFLQRQGIEDLRQMSRSEVDAYVAELRDGTLSARTAESWVGALKAFFRFMVDTNRMLLSPAEHVRERNLQHLVGPRLSPAQMKRLLRVPNTALPVGTRDRVILELLYSTGMRRQEIAGLSVFDVDLAGGQVRITQGKGQRERVVPLGTEAQKWLRLYLEKARAHLGNHRNGDSSDALLLGFDGASLGAPGIAAVVKRAGEAAGIRVSCHSLRRTMATEMLKGGAGIMDVARLLGHASATTTQRYTKVVPVDLRNAHEQHHPRGRGDGPVAGSKRKPRKRTRDADR
jgi:integrase/recombinase XerD